MVRYPTLVVIVIVIVIVMLLSLLYYHSSCCCHDFIFILFIFFRAFTRISRIVVSRFSCLHSASKPRQLPLCVRSQLDAQMHCAGDKRMEGSFPPLPQASAGGADGHDRASTTGIGGNHSLGAEVATESASTCAGEMMQSPKN